MTVKNKVPKVKTKPKEIPKGKYKPIQCYDDVPTPTTTCTEETPVPTVNDCTKPLTYWIKNSDKVTSLTLGSVEYPKTFVVDLLRLPSRQNGKQNGLIALAKELAVAKLNYYGGRACSTTASDLRRADVLIGNRFVSATTSGFLEPNTVCELLKRLQNCNRGAKSSSNCNPTTTATITNPQTTTTNPSSETSTALTTTYSIFK